MTCPFPTNGTVRREEKVDALRTLSGDPDRSRQPQQEDTDERACSMEGCSPPTPDAASRCALQPRS